jgi:hypothetical protein
VSQHSPDIAKRLARIRVGLRSFRIVRKPVRDLCGKVAKLNPRQAHQFCYRQNHHLLSIVFRPRDCGVHGEAVSDGGGGDITWDRNEEEERATRA